MKRKNVVFIILAVIVAIAVIIGFHTLLFSQQSKKELAPNFRLTSIDGKVVELKNFRGKVVVLDFWATWCKPCVAEMAELKKLYEKYHDKIVIISVNIGEPEAIVKAFVTINDINWIVVIDKTREVSAKYGIRFIPTLFIIDKKGRIRYKHVGYVRFDRLEAVIKELLKE